MGKSVVEVNRDTQRVHSMSSSSQGEGVGAILDHFVVSNTVDFPLSYCCNLLDHSLKRRD